MNVNTFLYCGEDAHAIRSNTPYIERHSRIKEMSVTASKRALAVLLALTNSLAQASDLTLSESLLGTELSSQAPSSTPLPSEMNRFISDLSVMQALSASPPNLGKTLRGSKEADIYAAVAPGVVLVIGENGIGAGAVITRSGHIVTNLHVVANTATIRIAFLPRNPSERPRKQDLVGATLLKVNQRNDLALLKVETLPKHVVPISLSQKTVRVGEDVHAIGHPRGELWSYTKGYVSQLRTDYEWKTKESGVTHKANVIQTQTPINPGNSGGPLLSGNRELVGINTFKDSSNPGLNYAVDVSDVKSLLKQEGDVLIGSNKKSKCGTDPIGSYESENKLQGNVTVFQFDSNCDGVIEAELRIAKDKDKPNVFAFDTNSDGKFDAVVVDRDRDGKWDITYYDLNHDGQVDAYAINADGDLIASGELQAVKR